MTTVFLGWDSRESLAYEVARHSIQRRSLAPVEVIPLKHKQLRTAGLFTRPWSTDSLGQTYDTLTKEPVSTEFSFTRFLVPYVARMNNKGPWVLFADCDILCLSPIELLFAFADDTKAALVVKHQYRGKGATKMDGLVQVPYGRKLWSSVVLWNVGHEANRALTPELVNSASGKFLHNFEWLKDDDIGALPEEWNFIPGHSQLTMLDGKAFQPSLIHYTEGGPWFDAYRDSPMAELWTKEETHYLGSSLSRPSERIRL